jgi:hypothetical protein
MSLWCGAQAQACVSVTVLQQCEKIYPHPDHLNRQFSNISLLFNKISDKNYTNVNPYTVI